MTTIQNAINTLAAFPLRNLTHALEGATFYEEIIECFEDEDFASGAHIEPQRDLADYWGVRPEWIDLAHTVVSNHAYSDLLQHYNVVMAERLHDDLSVLADLDATTLDRVLNAHKALREARKVWCDHRLNTTHEPITLVDTSPDYLAFSNRTLNEIAHQHNLREGLLNHADRIHHEWGSTGFDELIVRFAEKRIAQECGIAHPDMVYAAPALMALPTTEAEADHLFAAATGYTSGSARHRLAMSRRGHTRADIKSDPAYIAFVRPLLSSLLLDHGVTESQLLHEAQVGADYLGHGEIRRHHLNALAPRVHAIVSRGCVRP